MLHQPNRQVNSFMKLIITVDVEGDNLWSSSTSMTTKNAHYIPRFQDLCSLHGFKPTYLVDYEMANDQIFQEFGREMVRKGAAEIGMHLHAWNTPPLYTKRGLHHHPIYITELPDQIIYEKMAFMTSLLHDVFHSKPLSHRSGRWGFDERVARVLSELGYHVDCSVTPGVSWRHHKGDPDGKGGPDYNTFSVRPYFLDLDNIRLAGEFNILEVPVTIRPMYPKLLRRLFHIVSQSGLLSRAVEKFLKPYVWLRPTGYNVLEMNELAGWALSKNLPVMELILHSSELMPGGSPYFPEKDDIETLFNDLERFLAHASALRITGATLAEYRQICE